MKFKLVLSLIFLVLSVTANFAQTELTIKKKSSMKIPGMPAMPAMPPGMPNPMDSMNNRKSTVYIKGSRMRTDTKVKAGDKAPMILTTIIQCDKQRHIQFTSKKKKYYVESTNAPTSVNVKSSTKGGFVTVTGSVTDTGERAKLFGYDARHLKETITFTPSKDACMKQPMQIDIEGWYSVGFGFEIVVIVDDLAFFIAQPESNDDAMNRRDAARFVAPLKGSMREINPDSMS